MVGRQRAFSILRSCGGLLELRVHVEADKVILRCVFGTHLYPAVFQVSKIADAGQIVSAYFGMERSPAADTFPEALRGFVLLDSCGRSAISLSQ